MPEVPSIERLQRRLVELGCPAEIVRRIVRETAEHYEDLWQAAMRQGLPPAEAARLAAEQLGDPAVLAERHVVAWRNTFASGFWPRAALVLSPLVVVGLPLVFWAGCPFFTFLAAFLGLRPNCTGDPVYPDHSLERSDAVAGRGSGLSWAEAGGQCFAR
jgi:hypothetical protein